MIFFFRGVSGSGLAALQTWQGPGWGCVLKKLLKCECLICWVLLPAHPVLSISPAQWQWGQCQLRAQLSPGAGRAQLSSWNNDTPGVVAGSIPQLSRRIAGSWGVFLGLRSSAFAAVSVSAVPGTLLSQEDLLETKSCLIKHLAFCICREICLSQGNNELSSSCLQFIKLIN